MTWVGLAVLALVIASAGSIVWQSLRLGISPMPSSAKAVAAVCRLVPKDTTGTIAELGAGWGGLALALARRAPRAHVVAFEASWVPFAVFWLRARWARLPNLELHRANFLNRPLPPSTTWVTCYLSPGAMAALGPKFRAELAAGSRVITNTFALRGWPAAQTVHLDDWYRTKVYLYVVS